MANARIAPKRLFTDSSDSESLLQSLLDDLGANFMGANFMAPGAAESPIAQAVDAPAAETPPLFDFSTLVSDSGSYGEAGATTTGLTSNGATAAVGTSFTIYAARDAYIARPNGLYVPGQCRIGEFACGLAAHGL